MRICVYTVLLGRYDSLIEQPTAAESDADFVCFTDDETLVSNTWQIERVTPYMPQDLPRSSRVYKILGHPSLDKYDVTICIDASVLLRSTPEEVVARFLAPDIDMGLAEHSYREMLMDEFDEVVRLNYDAPARVYEQLSDYATYFPEVLTARPLWGGMLVRRNTSDVTAAMRVWFDQVLRYSRRDQLSLPFALDSSGIRYRAIPLDNFSSELHEWPVITDRKVANGKARSLPSAPLLVELRRAERRITELNARIAELDPSIVAELERKLAQAQTEIEQGTVERVTLEHQLEGAHKQTWHSEQQLLQARSVRGAARNLADVVVRKFTRPVR